MRSRLSRYFKDNVVAFLALFVALGGTSAYAANTVFSTDIVDGQVKSVDIGDGEVGSADVKDNSINTFDVHSFLGVDVRRRVVDERGCRTRHLRRGTRPAAQQPDRVHAFSNQDAA